MFLPYIPLANVLFAFRSSHAPGKIIVLVLFLGSIFAWTIMVTKIAELRRAQSNARRFLRAYREEGHPLELFLKKTRHGNSPLFEVYFSACRTLGGLLDGGGSVARDSVRGEHVGAIRNMAQRTMADIALRLERNMGFLATAVTTAPFLGLLGTVWGVMEAFGSMASRGSATLSAVAPGISGALLTTVVGLLVALPSSIGYNMLTSRIRVLAVEMENFVEEFVADLERHFHIM